MKWALLPGVSGFFLLVSQANGAVALLREGGEEVGTLVAMHVWMFGATPQPIPRPAQSLLLPRRAQPHEVQSPGVEAGRAATGELVFKLGVTIGDRAFSGIVLFGAVPVFAP